MPKRPFRACHPERSEGSLFSVFKHLREMLRCAQHTLFPQAAIPILQHVVKGLPGLPMRERNRVNYYRSIILHFEEGKLVEAYHGPSIPDRASNSGDCDECKDDNRKIKATGVADGPNGADSASFSS